MIKVRFTGEDGVLPTGGTPGAWTVGKIYDLDTTHRLEKFSPEDVFLFVKQDDRGESNGWAGKYFEIVDRLPPEEPSDRVGDIHTVLAYLYFRSKKSPGDIWGGVRVEEAYSAACRLAGIPELNANQIFGA